MVFNSNHHLVMKKVACKRPFLLFGNSQVTNVKIMGGVLKSMLASDVAIIDVKEHHIKHFEVIIELLRETTGFSNRSS